MKKNLILAIFLLASILLISASVSAADCPVNWTFVSKTSYNVCYRANQSATSTFNITDKSNNTLMSYAQEQTGSGGATNYFANFSDLQTSSSGIQYITYKGTQAASQPNSTVKGIIWFMEDFIYISGERRIYSNTSSLERMVWNNHNVASFMNANGTAFPANQSGNTPYFSTPSVRVASNLLNYTQQGWASRLNINKTSEVFFANTFLNRSHFRAYNSTATIINEASNGWSAVQIRTNNQTEFPYHNGGSPIPLNNNIANSGWVYEAGFLIQFGTPYFSSNDGYANGSVQVMNNHLRGLQEIDDGCETSFSTIYVSCSPWDYTTGARDAAYLLKLNTTPSIVQQIQELRTAQLHLLHINSTDHNRTAIPDYNFQPPTLRNVTDNSFNQTHTRFIEDALMGLLALPSRSSFTNTTIGIFINYLQRNVRTTSIDNSSKIIIHSANTDYFDERAFVLNTHSATVVSLIYANKRGYSVNTSLLSEFVDSSIKFYPYMFNESLTNTSYYRLASDGLYHVGQGYGNAVYTVLEVQDYSIIYSYTRNDTARTIMNRKLDEITRSFNGTAYTCSHGSCSAYTLGGNNYQYAKAYYQNMSNTAFSYLAKISTQFPGNNQYTYNYEYVPNNLEFVDVFYPIYLGKDNKTYFVNNDNGLMFSTPMFSFIHDFKWDTSGTGMRFWLKWGQATSGSFTNISSPSYRYFYDPQQQRFINYSESLTWAATTSTLNYWSGNLSSSTRFRIQENYGVNLSIDGESLGLENSSLSITRSDSSQKNISSTLSSPVANTTLILSTNGTNTSFIYLYNSTGDLVENYTTGEFSLNRTSQTMNFTATIYSGNNYLTFGCEESWSCTAWLDKDNNATFCYTGEQIRTCTDQNTCGTTVLKPAEQQYCEPTSGGSSAGGSSSSSTSTEQETSETQSNTQNEQQEETPSAEDIKERQQLIAAAVILAILLIIASVIAVAVLKKPKRR